MKKIVEYNELESKISQSGKIIFTHGAFDLLHIGHIELLKNSKQFGKTLVVGVDSDEAVTLYKRKPVMSQNQRANILSSLYFVDHVVLLPTIKASRDFDYFFLKLYLQLRPDVVTYGSNFNFMREVGLKCRLAGIRNKKLSHVFNDITTTGYIKSIQKRDPVIS